MKIKGGKIVRSFVTSDKKNIERLEAAHRLRAQGAYVTFKGEPIAIVALHYSRVHGVVKVKVDYERAVRPSTQ